MTTICIVGSGGREHALGWKLAQSDAVTRVLYAPGNGGTAEGKGENVAIDATQAVHFEAFVTLLREREVDLIVIGPEAPLSWGIVDRLRECGISQVFGPSAAATLLESDKFFSYKVMTEVGIPQATSIPCQDQAQAEVAIEMLCNPQGVVLKARGLAAGKGVVVADDAASATAALVPLIAAYGPDILVCERLSGQEFSVFGLCDGRQVLPLALSFQDHKRQSDGDRGPNTGGMGAYGPAPVASHAAVAEAAAQVMTPLIQHMHDQGTPFVGFLYAGFMQTAEGPKVLEFNVRFGDPECQPAMTLLDEDLYALLDAAVEGRLPSRDLAFREGASCCVVLASQGYPGPVTKGLPISGIAAANAIEGIKVFHAGTTHNEDGACLTAGGRVLGVTAYAKTGLADAQALAYKAVAAIDVPGGFHFRTDIANKGL